MAGSPVQIATELIALVESDHGLPPDVRQWASSLRDRVHSAPDLAIQRLEEEAHRMAEVLPCRRPNELLSKSLSLEAFYRYYLDSDIKDRFSTVEDYRRYLAVQPDIAEALRDTVKKDGVLVDARHSWLAPYGAIRDLTGAEIVEVLELPRARPPLVVLVFRPPRDTFDEFWIRTPRATDAVPERHTGWRPGGLASGVPEFIDRDVPAAALGSVEWRP